MPAMGWMSDKGIMEQRTKNLSRVRTVTLNAFGVDEDALVTEHLPLAHRAVSDMLQRVPRHVSRSDLLSAAMAGLAQAAPCSTSSAAGTGPAARSGPGPAAWPPP